MASIIESIIRKYQPNLNLDSYWYANKEESKWIYDNVEEATKYLDIYIDEGNFSALRFKLKGGLLDNLKIQIDNCNGKIVAKLLYNDLVLSEDSCYI